MANSSSQNHDNADLDAEDYKLEENTARRYIEQHGVAGFENYITERVSAWRNTPLNIAVTGFTGVGKSTLINTFCGMTPEDEGAAKTGTTECTHEITCYPHSTNKNLNFWDLPGVGTAKNPRETYLDEMQFERFDFILIISGNRFTEDDIWLAETLKNMKKNFFFVRSKIDDDLRNAQRDYPKTFNKMKEMTKIRNSCIEHLKPIVGDVETVYLISGLLGDTSKYECGKLLDDLIENYPKLKRQALVLSLDIPCKEVIKAKATTLRNQWKVTAALDAVLAVPLSLLGMNASQLDFISNSGLVCDMQIDEAIKALGLNCSAIEQLTNTYDIPMEKFSALTKQVSDRKSAVKAFLKSIRNDISQTSNENDFCTGGPITTATLNSIPGVRSRYIWKSIRTEWIKFVDNLEELALTVIDITIKPGTD